MPENMTLLQVQGSGTETMCLGTVTAESLPQQYKELFYPIMQCTLLKMVTGHVSANCKNLNLVGLLAPMESHI